MNVWASIALVNSANSTALTWSVPGQFAYAAGLPILSGADIPLSSDGVNSQLYIQTGSTPQTIWFKESGTWTRLTGSTLYVDLVNNQTIGGTKTFSSQIQGSVSGTSSNVTGTVAIANGGTGQITANSALNALLPSQATNASKVLTTDGSNTSWQIIAGSGTVTSINVSGGTTGLTTSGGPVTTSGTITLAGTLGVANGGTGATTAATAIQNLLPSYTSNANKRLGLNSGGTALEWVLDGGGTVTSINASGGTTGLTFSGGPITTNGTLTLSGTLAVANGGTGVTSSSGANSVVLRDANGNITTNCLFEGYVSQAASGTAIVLIASSAQNYQITGSGGQTIKLPDATTLPNGATFTFNNNQSSGAITVQNNSSTTVATIQSGGYVTIVLLSNSIAAGSWDRHDSTPSNVSWSTNTLDYAGSITSATWNGTTVQLNRGGTGQTTAQAAMNSFAGAVTSGFYLRGNGTNVVMSAIQAADVPTLNQNTTGTAANITASSNSTLTTLSALSLPGSQVTGNISGNAGNVTGTVAVANGGTGLTTTPANGALDIGNGTGFTRTTLTAGSGVTITNAAGSITINATGTGGDVVGPSSATANGIALFNSTTGKLIKDSASTDGLIRGITVGFGGGSISSNTAFGVSALTSNTTGYTNVAIGQYSLANNTTAYANTAVGNLSGNRNSTGTNNSYIGYAAGQYNQTGNDNTVIGNNAIGGSTTGSHSYNTAIGSTALYSTTTGGNNTGIGFAALRSNSTGANNSVLGYRSGYSITTGGKNVIIGSYEGLAAPISQTGSNYIVFSDGDANVRGYFDGSGNLNVASLTASSVVFTDASKNLTSTGTVSVAQGGTGTSTPSLVAGTNVTITGTWPNQTINSSNTGGTVTSVAASGGTTGLTFTGSPITTSGTLTLGGTLAIANGGTGLTSFTANGVVYASSTSALATGSALTFDGTNFSIGGTSDPFGRFYTRSVGITSSGSSVLEISGTSYGAIDMGTGATRYFSLLGNSTDAIIGTLNGAIPLEFQINGSEQMRLTSTGLGIGTSSPARKLQVKGTGAMFNNASGAFEMLIGDENYRYFGLYTPSSPDYISIRTGTTDIIKLDALASNVIVPNGNLGVGFTPSTWYSTFKSVQFGGNGSSVFGRSENNSAAIGSNMYVNSVGNNTYINTNTASYYQQLNGQHQFYVAPSGTAGTTATFTQGMTLDNSSQLQIGTTTASGKLTIDNTGASTPLIYAKSADQSGARIALSNTGTGGQTWQIVAGDVAVSNSGLSFYDGTATRMRLDSNGNFMVGQTSATGTNKLSITTSGLYAATFRSSGTSGVQVDWAVNGSSIGTIGSGVLVTSTASATDFGIGTSGTSANLVFATGTGYTERMRLDSSGNLGLGVTPSAWSPRAIQVGSWGGIQDMNGVANQIAFRGNLYYNSGDKFLNASGYAHTIALDSTGGIQFYTSTAASSSAGSSASMSQRMTLETSGNLLVGATSQVSNTTLSKVAIVGPSDSSSTTIKTFPQGLSIANPVNANASGYGVAMRFQFSSASDGVGKYAAIAGIATSNYANSTGLAFYTTDNAAGGVDNVTERARIDSSGNLGLGVTPTNNTLGKTLQVGQAGAWVAESGTNRWWLGSNWYYNSGDKYINNGYATLYSQQNGAHQWFTSASGTAGAAISFTEAMRIDSSANLLVGTTSNSAYTGKAVFSSSSQTNIVATTAGAAWGFISNQGNAGTQYFARFDYNNTQIGSIQGNNTVTTYNSTSDYRLKNVIGAITGHGERLDSLEPIEYEWKSNGSRTRGFLAHKFQEVYANSVTGIKDAVDADGNPEYQAMQAGSAEVIADLVAEIQSLRKRLADAGI
jgi:hypothetical protein